MWQGEEAGACITGADRARGGSAKWELPCSLDAEEVHIELEEVRRVRVEDRGRDDRKADLADLAVLLDHSDRHLLLALGKAAHHVKADQSELAVTENGRRREGSQVATRIAADEASESARSHDLLVGKKLAERKERKPRLESRRWAQQ